MLNFQNISYQNIFPSSFVIYLSILYLYVPFLSIFYGTLLSCFLLLFLSLVLLNVKLKQELHALCVRVPESPVGQGLFRAEDKPGICELN